MLALPVYRSDWFVVIRGANLGDPLADAAGLNLTDVYRLNPDARMERLAIAGDGQTMPFEVGDNSALGRTGATLHLDCCATFMCPDGSTIEALIIVETDDGMIDATYLVPLATIRKGMDHTLVAVHRDRAVARFANMGCASFARGTHIALGDGRQVPIEDLRPEDRVLTRARGPQPIRWIGQQTVRAAGAFAPIRIAKGVLHNHGPLTLAPNHRLFIYQRQDRLGAGRAEVMIRASQLVNDDTVTKSEGGFVDYFQLLFDQHEVIYAEGIAAESLFATPHVQSALPDHVKLLLSPTNASTDTASELELQDADLDPSRIAEELRRASRS